MPEPILEPEGRLNRLTRMERRIKRAWKVVNSEWRRAQRKLQRLHQLEEQYYAERAAWLQAEINANRPAPQTPATAVESKA